MYFMKYINKYIKFFENFDLVEPKVATQVMVAEPKIDENEIANILKEIEEESRGVNPNNSDIKVDMQGIANAKAKFNQ